MTETITRTQARQMIEDGAVRYATDVHVSRMGARRTSLRWYLVADDEQITGLSARNLTLAKQDRDADMLRAHGIAGDRTDLTHPSRSPAW